MLHLHNLNKLTAPRQYKLSTQGHVRDMFSAATSNANRIAETSLCQRIFPYTIMLKNRMQNDISSPKF